MKRVLIVSYYWPPSGGIAVLRCLKFAKYLRQSGWEPVIFTADGAHYPTLDESNNADLPENLEVIRQPIWEPYAWYKKFMGKPADENVNNVFYTDESAGGWKHRLAVWVRSNFFIPDARATWIRGSVNRILEYLKDNPVDAILSDGPPHSNTRIATLVSRATGLPWLADFQDPWTQVDYYQMLNLTAAARKKHERLEQEAFRQASLTTIVSPSWKTDLESIGARNVRVLYWGYDPNDFAGLQRQPHRKFTLTHLGIMGHDRHPEVLFRAIAQLKEEVEGFTEDFELRLFGQVDHRVRRSIEDHGLVEQTHFGGTVSRREALQETLDSHLLLLLLNQQDNATGRIPGKFFEYLAARRPILNFGPMDSDVARIMEKTNSGCSLGYDMAPARVAEYLNESYQSYRRGDTEELDREVIKEYSHPRLVKQLAGWLNEIAA
ncbi:glycosyltransferase involved in cell wall biosynthesis [Lewinella marina]|uniref:Glycosyl transferase family 1 n=1 Tax=Neolewinella marina TaxID=438751 RepID=A0A2G0CC44_9BACT|nr:glycosyltransferase [Neolewinella marina]NJB86690.1 glycosyltransferase involved in cell wall biosynthesis [Neolewinella marina]PHK97497.1 glycosyl transferase family 1 [Neolewinella marina]